MHIHHCDTRIIWIVGLLALKHCLEINRDTVDRHANIVMVLETEEFGSGLRLFIDFPASGHKFMEQALDLVKCSPRYICFDPVTSKGSEIQVSVIIPILERVSITSKPLARILRECHRILQQISLINYTSFA